MYLGIETRPDIAQAISVLSQFNKCHQRAHWIAAKRILRYLKGTMDLKLTYMKDDEKLKSYVDADWGNCIDDRRSYTGLTFILSGAAISWESRKQGTVALSSTVAEYMSLTDATKEAIHLIGFLEELEFSQLVSAEIFNDNQGAGELAANPVFHSRSKHIDLRHHFIREVLNNRPMIVIICSHRADDRRRSHETIGRPKTHLLYQGTGPLSRLKKRGGMGENFIGLKLRESVGDINSRQSL